MAADTDLGLDHTVDAVHRMATDMASTTKSAEGLSGIFRQAALTVVGVERLAGLVGGLVRRTTTWQSLEKAISSESLSRVHLRMREIELDNEILNLERKLRDSTGEVGELHLYQKQLLEGERDVLKKQTVFAAELQRYGHARLTGLFAYKVAAADMFLKERELNQNLIEANSSLSTRQYLLKESLLTTAQLGISFGQVTSAARALVHWGMDTEATFSENLKLVAQMEQGLGVSVNESARLASIVERQLRGSFEGVAHVVAQLVNDTALAGDEAARLATSISTAMGRLRPGMSAQGLPEVLRLVGRYESALKEVGGAPGAFQQLIESLTRPEGIVGAGALGVSPEFIATSRGVQDVMERFTQYGEALVGQSEGWARQMRLQALAEIFHLSADQANQLLIAAKRARDEQVNQISVQDRWREQLHATNAGIVRLGHSLTALLNGAMYPVVFVVGAVINKMADFLELLLKTPAAVYTLSGALFVGFVGLTVSIHRVARALLSTIVTSNLAAGALARFNASMAATAGTSFLGGATRFTGVWGFPVLGPIVAALRSVFTVGFWQTLVTSIRAIAVGVGATAFAVTSILTAIGIVAYFANKQWSETRALREQSRQLEVTNAERVKALEQNRMARIYTEARNLGSPEAILKQVSLLAQDIRKEATSEEDYKAKLAAAAEEAITAIDQGVTTRVAFTPLKERTPQEAKAEDDLLNLTGKIYDVNRQAQDEYKKRGKLEEEMNQSREVEISKQRLMNQFNDMSRRRNDMPFY